MCFKAEWTALFCGRPVGKGWRYRGVACWKRVIKSDNALYPPPLETQRSFFSFFFFNHGGINPRALKRGETWMKAEQLNFTSLKRRGGEGREGEEERGKKRSRLKFGKLRVAVVVTLNTWGWRGARWDE